MQEQIEKENKKFNSILIIKRKTNNLFISFSSKKKWFSFSTGILGLIGSKRSTLFAFKGLLKFIIKKLRQNRIGYLVLIFKNIYFSESKIIKFLINSNMTINSIIFQPKIAHNGCRKPVKPRIKKKTKI